MTEPKDQWSWRLLIRTPDFIGKREIEAARKQLAEKGKGPLFKEVELTTLNENQCVQMLHIGPYDREPESIAQMQAIATGHGYRFGDSLVGTNHGADTAHAEGLSDWVRPGKELAREALAHNHGTRCALIIDRKSTRLNSSHLGISYAVFCLKKKKK